MGENVRELTPLERENQELKAKIEAMTEELKKVTNRMFDADAMYGDVMEENAKLKRRIDRLNSAIITMGGLLSEQEGEMDEYKD